MLCVREINEKRLVMTLLDELDRVPIQQIGTVPFGIHILAMFFYLRV